MLFNKKGQIGVSISDDTIEIIEIMPSKSGIFEAVDFSYLEIDSKIIENGNILNIDAFAISLKKAFSENGAKFSSNNVYFALPDPATFFHTFGFPGAVSDREIPNAISFKYDEIFPIPVNAGKGDYAIVARNKNETIVQYALASLEVIRQYSEAFKKAGLVLTGIGLDAQAIEKAILGNPEEKKATLVVNITKDSASLFLRDVYGIHATFYELFDKTGKAEVLSKEIISVIGWYKRVSPENIVDEVIFVGSENESASLFEKVKKLISEYDEKINIKNGNPFARIGNASQIKNISKNKEKASFTVALGAAINESWSTGKRYEFLPSAKSGPTIIKSKYVETAGQKSDADVGLYISTIPEKKKTIIAVSFAIATILFLGMAFYWYYSESNKAENELLRLRQAQQASAQVAQ